MKLSELLNIVKAIQVTGEFLRKDIVGIFYDSRKVIPGSIFVAIKGYSFDGHKFIIEAINKGATAVVLEDNNAVPEDFFTHRQVTKILVKNSRIALAELSSAYYGYPSNLLKLIGITGTNGKTTTTYFVKSILEQNGNKTGLFGTIANYIGDEELPSSLTTPESNDLSRILLSMTHEGCSYCVMEVFFSFTLPRQGIRPEICCCKCIQILHRIISIFTARLKNTGKPKKILFDSLDENAFAIVNLDDESANVLVSDCKAKVLSYGKSHKADFVISGIEYDLEGTSFKITHKEKTYAISTKLIGAFNAYNAAAAFVLGIAMGIEPEVIIEGIKNTKQVPGRFEVVGTGKKKVIVDYSHTADSLEKAVTTIRGLTRDKIPVYTVFGCGGNRDKTKRPVMGKIAGENSKKTFVTSDNPRFEDPFAIIADIETGMALYNYVVVENREEAIKRAIMESEEEAVILVAGKGHEYYQEINGVRNHFSDKEVAEKYL